MTKLEQDEARYQAAMHAMQSGVAYMPANDHVPGMVSRECTPKHLRVGVNSAMTDTATIVSLLIAKGIFTEEEFMAALADQAESEAASYEAQLSEAYGNAKVTLA